MVLGVDFALENASGQGDGKLHHLVAYGVLLALFLLFRFLTGVFEDLLGLFLRTGADGLGVLVRLRHDLRCLTFGLSAGVVQNAVALGLERIYFRAVLINGRALLCNFILPVLQELGHRLV